MFTSQFAFWERASYYKPTTNFFDYYSDLSLTKHHYSHKFIQTSTTNWITIKKDLKYQQYLFWWWWYTWFNLLLKKKLICIKLNFELLCKNFLNVCGQFQLFWYSCTTTSVSLLNRFPFFQVWKFLGYFNYFDIIIIEQFKHFYQSYL